MMLMMRLVLLFTLSAAVAAEGIVDHSIGSVPNMPVRLNKDNFKKTIEDPANPIWLLKFYAPWCGHCKKLIPILDRVAEKMTGKMAVGLIDCTSSGKTLCNEYDVTGFPTLKFSIDGDIQPYPSGRSEKDFIAFARKMSSLPVEETNTVEQLQAFTKTFHEKISFIAYHPLVSALSKPIRTETPSPTEGEPPVVTEEIPVVQMADKLKSTPLTQVFAAVARKEQAFGHFFLLDTLDTNEAAALSPKGGAFVCRVEIDIPTRCFDGAVTIDEMLAFVRGQNVPTLSAFGPRNFNTIGRKGRPLVIGVVDEIQNTEMLNKMKDALTEAATNGAHGDEYYFGWFQGLRWAKFLEQFSVEKAPEIFVLDVPNKIYWQDSSYKYDVEGFLQAIADGKVESRKARRKGVEGVLDFITDFATDYTMAVSMAAYLFLFMLFVRVAIWAASDDDLPAAAPIIKEEETKKTQ